MDGWAVANHWFVRALEGERFGGGRGQGKRHVVRPIEVGMKCEDLYVPC